tara:strand:- start:1230 stop:2414 length:1185 start_codon:yes stop_codon:yes gene_type:complete
MVIIQPNPPGYIPKPEFFLDVASTPYDVVDNSLDQLLRARKRSLIHVLNSDTPGQDFDRFLAQDSMNPYTTPSFFVLEQTYDGINGRETRTAIYAHVELTDHPERDILIHEGTDQKKVDTRKALRQQTNHSFGAALCYTPADISSLLDSMKTPDNDLYPGLDLKFDLQSRSDMHGITHKIYQVDPASAEAKSLTALLLQHALWMLDGHHRLETAIQLGQTKVLVCITDQMSLQAYDRVFAIEVDLTNLDSRFTVTSSSKFETPQHQYQFSVYISGQPYTVSIDPTTIDRDDEVNGLDCTILNNILLPSLGIDPNVGLGDDYVRFLPQSRIQHMQALVDGSIDGEPKFGSAFALHPMSPKQFMGVADAGKQTGPKTTYFSPKIPTWFAAQLQLRK